MIRDEKDCPYGKYLEKRLEDMEGRFVQLEDRFYKAIIGSLSFLVLQLVTILMIYFKK